MKKVSILLTAIIVSTLLVTLLIAVLFETDVLENGTLALDKELEFIMSCFMTLGTLLSVYLTLRLFKFNAVRSQLLASPESAMKKWGALRICLLMVPIVLNILSYYLFMNASFGYLAIISLLCLPFVWPTVSRCIAETSKQ